MSSSSVDGNLSGAETSASSGTTWDRQNVNDSDNVVSIVGAARQGRPSIISFIVYSCSCCQVLQCGPSNVAVHEITSRFVQQFLKTSADTPIAKHLQFGESPLLLRDVILCGVTNEQLPDCF